jgi:hypothetical protein
VRVSGVIAYRRRWGSLLSLPGTLALSKLCALARVWCWGEGGQEWVMAKRG